MSRSARRAALPVEATHPVPGPSMVTDREGQSHLLGLTGLTPGDPSYVFQRALAMARSVLGMEVGFIAELTETHMVFQALEGDKESFGWDETVPVPIEASYCRLMVSGELDNVVNDSLTHPVAGGIPATSAAGIGAYIGVPVWLSDGSVYGSFCCLSHAPDFSLGEREVRFLHLMARMVADSIDRHRLMKSMADAAIQGSSIQALIAAVDAREPYTAEHSSAVLDIADTVAGRLGLDDERMAEIRQVALLHDLGKIGIPDSVLLKRGPLDQHEWAIMREHPAIGERLISAIDGLAHLAPAIRAEHERWDGNGYPDGLAGEQIPVASRICLVCDAWHAMRSDRPYRKAMTHADAVTELMKHRGTQFWPPAVDALIAAIGADQ